MTSIKRVPLLALALFVAACSVTTMPTPDVASDSVTPADQVADADDAVTFGDVSEDTQSLLDVTVPDIELSDASRVDHPVSIDGPVAPDVTVLDVPRVDVAVAVDAPRTDVLVVDVPRVDVSRVDVVLPPTDVGCPGTAPVVTVVAPTANEMIETCTAGGTPVYYVFRANVSATAGVRQVVAQLRSPSGAVASPPLDARVTAPFEWRRQVGGPAIAGAPPALAILAGALRGTWQFEVTATDLCGRSTLSSQPFTLMYTTRRCPNP